MERPTLLTYTSSDGDLNTEAYVRATMEYLIDFDTDSDWDLWPESKSTQPLY